MTAVELPRASFSACAASGVAGGHGATPRLSPPRPARAPRSRMRPARTSTTTRTPPAPGEGRHRLEHEDRRQRPREKPNHPLGHERLPPQPDPRQDDQHRGGQQHDHHGGDNARARRGHLVLDAVGVEPPGATPASSRRACRPGQPEDRVSRAALRRGCGSPRLPLSVPSDASSPTGRLLSYRGDAPPRPDSARRACVPTSPSRCAWVGTSGKALIRRPATAPRQRHP